MSDSHPSGDTPESPRTSGSQTSPGEAVTTTYDLLTARLTDIANRLRSQATNLNEERAQIFASNPMTLGEQDRLHTDALSMPRDAVSVNNLLLFGANVPSGLAARNAADMLLLYRVQQTSPTDWDFSRIEPNSPDWFLNDPGLTRDLGEILTYYSEARLLSLEVRGEELLAVFGIGTSDDDIRVLRWQLSPGQPPVYIDAYGERDVHRENRYDFTWTETGRQDQVDGRWPHVNVEQLVFIGIDKGYLDFRIEDTVTGGKTLLSERIDEVDQSLSELKISYARIGDLILLRVLPYREPTERFYLYNRLSRSLDRADAIGRGCHQLPEGHGVVFPGGYHLRNGETRVFATDASDYCIHASHKSPNGEDVLYAYHRPVTGEYLLLSYNMVSRSMAPPVECVGYALFPDGTIVCVRAAKEPQRIHTVAVYSSPFCAPEQYQPPVASNSFFGRIGNPELVLAIGECLSIARDAESVTFNAPVFETLVARCTRLIDTHAWLTEGEANGLAATIVDLRKSSGAVLDEFASVATGKREAAGKFDAASAAVADLASGVEVEIRDTDTYIVSLASARTQLGELAALREVRYVDQESVQDLERRTSEILERLSVRALDFLGHDDALAPVLSALSKAEKAATAATTSTLVHEQVTVVETMGERLVMLTEVVGGLEVTDTTVATAVLARLSDALAKRNAARATMDARQNSLKKSESAAAFTAGISVLAQRTSASLLASNDAASCDSALAGLLAEVENLELRFGDVQSFSDVLVSRRQEISDAVLARRDALAAERTKRVDRLVTSAERVMQTLELRASKLPDRATVDAFFASDGLALKVRRSIEELAAIGEQGRASELTIALDSSKERARRGATDRAELMAEGMVRIGRHNIGTNNEPFELRLVPDDVDGRGFQLRLAGTELRIPLPDERLAEYHDLAEQIYPSETAEFSRALFLAFEAVRGNHLSTDAIRAFAATRLGDGYEPGVHDVDADVIAQRLRPSLATPGAWCAGVTRSITALWWRSLDIRVRDSLSRSMRAVTSLGPGRAMDALVTEHGPALVEFAKIEGLDEFFDTDDAVAVLLETVGALSISRVGADRGDDLIRWTRDNGLDVKTATLGELTRWAFDLHPNEGIGRAAEAAWRLLDSSAAVFDAPAVVSVSGLSSTHPTIIDGTLTINVAEASSILRKYKRHGLQRFQQFQTARREELSGWHSKLAVDRLRPRVLSSFVRNRLVDEVYLPLLGENLARQLGLNGPSQGLLLLTSPPGYGKTTLIEYLVDLLGFALVKINGPALGPHVTSLDPAAAPDATSAEELRRMNRAFAMGTNVVCYLDDMQHVSPEFLQRFVPLCDATRRIEGVLEGVPRTYDLSGRRFVMVMAGNPYTGAGASFRVPDMLANRADVHNLGEMVTGAADAFAQSYIENACGANELLSPVIARGRGDLGPLVRAAMGEQIRSEDLTHTYSAADLQRITGVLRHFVQIRDVLMKVNAAYMQSATLDDGLRGEPPFLLQGSYRNMARIAPRVVPAMTSAEVRALIRDHYQAESQTLAAAASWNLAKLAEVLGSTDPVELALVEQLRERYRATVVGDNPLAVIAGALRGIQEDIRVAVGNPGGHPTGRHTAE
jgi:flagellin-like hook-associated protein FlgL